MDKVNRMLFHLDCFLDTRLATIEMLDPSVVPEVLMSGYHSRDIDVFTGINTVEFRDAYAKRNINTLKLSRPTNMLFYKLVKWVNEGIIDTLETPFHTSFEVVINTWPYNLSESEVNLMSLSIKVHMDTLVPLKFIHASPKQLTPDWIANNYSIVFLYDFDEWANAHLMRLAKKQIKDVLFVAPAIKKLTKEEAKEQKEYLQISGDKFDFEEFDAIEKTAAAFCTLKLIDIEDFSIVRPLEAALEEEPDVYDPKPKTIIT